MPDLYMNTNIKKQFSPERITEIQELMKRYPAEKSKSALIPLLHMAQADFDGWLSPESMDYVAEILQIEPIEVYEVASFYSMFNLKPMGKFVLEVCHTGPCMVVGVEKIISYLESSLQIKKGQTTADGLFSIKTVECLGSCGTAPMMQCGAKYYENLTEEKIDLLLESFRNTEKRPAYTDLV